jgi:hypothetical protein
MKKSPVPALKVNFEEDETTMTLEKATSLSL